MNETRDPAPDDGADEAPSPHQLARIRQAMPGCGLAAYLVILLTIATAGVVGMSIALWSLIAGSETSSPYNLAYGGMVDPAVLEPMREAGGLGPEEIPEAFHMETLDGSSACALSGGQLIRLERGTVTRLSLREVQKVEDRPDGVSVKGPIEIFCPFSAGEGGDRFRRMVEAARRR